MKKPLLKEIVKKHVAIIDVGSNSIKTNIYSCGDKYYELIFADKYVCGFAKGLFKSKNINSDSIKRAHDYLRNLKNKLSGFPNLEIAAIATSALRTASNADEFITKAEKILDCEVQIISGEKEAELAAKAVILENDLVNGLAFDLGGGSLEIAEIKNDEITNVVSLELGHQVLADYGEDDIEHLRDFIRSNFNSVTWLKRNPKINIYLTGGKFRKLAKLHMKLTQGEIYEVHSYQLSKEKVKDLVKTKEKKIANSKRDSVLLYYSAILLDEMMDYIEPQAVVFCNNSIRDGILYELYENNYVMN